MMQEQDWEKAYRAFEANDVTLEEWYRARGLYRTYDDADFLRPNMAKDSRRAEMLDIGRRSTSYLLCELMASHFDGIGQHAEALELRLRALPWVPRWNADAVSTVLPGVASDLLRLGHVEGAERFARRALRWGPSNPDALLTLAEAALATGRAEEAYGILAYLDKIKWPKELGRDPLAKIAKEKGVKKPAAPKPYEPDPTTLERLDEAHAIRAFSVGTLASTGRRLRFRAMTAAMSGRFALAHHLVAGFAKAGRWGTGVEGAADAARNNAVMDFIARLPPGETDERQSYETFAAARDHKAIIALVEERRQKGDIAGLTVALLDHRQWVVSDEARKALVAMGVRTPLLESMEEGHRLMAEYIGWPDEPPRQPQRLGDAKPSATAAKPVPATKAKKATPAKKSPKR